MGFDLRGWGLVRLNVPSVSRFRIIPIAESPEVARFQVTGQKIHHDMFQVVQVMTDWADTMFDPVVDVIVEPTFQPNSDSPDDASDCGETTAYRRDPNPGIHVNILVRDCSQDGYRTARPLDVRDDGDDIQYRPDPRVASRREG